VRDDSFPLSTFPMFASRRGTAWTMEYAIGKTAEGERRSLEPRHVTTTREVMDAHTTFTDARRRNRRKELCASIAAAVAADARFDDVVTIEIVRGQHDAITFLVDDVRGPETAVARCKVAR
jgi:hypothetical protein